MSYTIEDLVRRDIRITEDAISIPHLSYLKDKRIRLRVGKEGAKCVPRGDRGPVDSALYSIASRQAILEQYEHSLEIADAESEARLLIMEVRGARKIKRVLQVWH
jgi:hypothetical protein